MSAISKASQRIPQSKLTLKTPAMVTLEKIIGHTVSDKYRIAIHPKTGDIAYLAGSIICIVNSKSFQPMKYFFNKANRNFNSLSYSPLGDYLAAGEASCKQPEILIYEPSAKDEPISILKGHKSGVKAMAFTTESEYLVSIGEQGDTRIILWDWKQSKRLDSKKLKREFCSLEFPLFGNYFITTGAQNIKFWTIDDNPETKSKVLNCKGADMGTRKDKIFIDAVCGKEITYALTENPGTLCLVNNDRKMVRYMDLKAEKGFVCKLGTKYIICACSDGIIRIFDPITLQHLATLPKPPPLGAANVMENEVPNAKIDKKIHADTIAVQLDEQNNLLIAVYSDRSMITWDIKNLAKITMKRSTLPHSAPINDIQIMPSTNPNITKFATCSSDCTIRCWNINENNQNISDQPRNIFCKELSQIIYTSSEHSHFKLRAIQQSVVINQDGQMRCLKISPDGRFVACGDQNGALKIYDTQNKWNLCKDIQAHNGEITCIDFVYDNEIKWMATGSRDRLIHIFDCANDFSRISSVEDQNSAIVALSLAIDKSELDPERRIRLITCGADKWIIFRTVSTSGIATKYHQENDKQCKPLCLTVNPYTLQAIVGQEKKISVWKIPSGKPLRTFELKVESGSHPISNISIIVDPTSSIIITSCSDKVIKARDFTNGKCILKITNAGYTSAIALTNDLKKLITVSMEGCIMIWSLPEDLVAYTQKKMLELNLKNQHDISLISQPKTANPGKDAIISEWEGVAGVSVATSPEKKKTERAKEAKESSEIAMNAAAYVQNLLAKMKPKDNINNEEKSKEIQSVENSEIEISKYSIKERPKEDLLNPMVSETGTEYDKETNKDFNPAESKLTSPPKETVEVRLSRSMPPTNQKQQEILEEEKLPSNKKEAKSPDISSPFKKGLRRSHSSGKDFIKPNLEEFDKKEEQKAQEMPKIIENKAENEKVESESQNVELAIDEESTPLEEMDVLGQLLLNQRDMPDDFMAKDLAVAENMKKRESLTSLFWKEKMHVDDELKNAYEEAHKDPNKRDKRDLIFPSQDNFVGKLPNYKESATNAQNILNDLDLAKNKPKPENAEIQENKKSPIKPEIEKINTQNENSVKKQEIAEIPKKPENLSPEIQNPLKTIQEKHEEETLSINKAEIGVLTEQYEKREFEIQTEEPDLLSEFKNLFSKLKESVNTGKITKSKSKNILTELKKYFFLGR